MNDTMPEANGIRLFNAHSPVFPTRLSVLVCIILSIGGIALGRMDSSLAVQANGFIAFIDIITSTLFMTAVSQTVRQPDYVFNYGYGKYESLAMLVGAFLLFGVLILTTIEAVSEINSQTAVENHSLLILFSVFSFLLIRFMATYLARAAKRHHVPLLKYDAEIWRVDSFIELGVIASLVIGMILNALELSEIGRIVDAAGAFALVGFALKVPLKHGRDALNQLLDRTLPEFIQFDILSVIAENLNKLCELKGVHTRQSGKDLFIEIDLVMPWDFTLEQVHEIEKVFRKTLREKYPTSILRIYFTPCARDCVLDDEHRCPVKIALKQIREENAIKAKENLNNTTD